MHIVLGGTGHVGSAVAAALVELGEAVTVVTHDDAKTRELEAKGLHVAIADIHDTDALRAIFRRGKRLFLINPPADPSTDTDVEERRSLTSILAALDDSGLEKIVAESTYGAQPGAHAGDLGVLYEMEQSLKSQPVPASVIRAAYYMTNWDASFETAETDGVVHSFYAADFELPMVAPHDIGRVAARLMTEPADRAGLHFVEGPERYTPADVAAAFASALGKPVDVAVTSRDEWVDAYTKLGFSDAAARSYAEMTAITSRGPETPESPERGETPLRAYVERLVEAQRKK